MKGAIRTKREKPRGAPTPPASSSVSKLLESLSPDPRVRGGQFERLCKWFLETDPVYRRQLRRVWLWGQWPGRWGADAGVDLVAEATSGALWAVQAKAYDGAYSITKADLDTFLSESNRAEFSFRLLIATTDHIGGTARRTVASQEKPIHLLLRSGLESAQVPWPASPDDLRAPRPRPKDLRPHQVEAVEASCRGFGVNVRGQLVMACGTGKTLAALGVAEKLRALRVLVLCPSLSLLGQTIREWLANARQPFAFLPVCSDETVTSDDGFTQHVSELGFPVTTDPGAILAFLAAPGRSVIFATYQSSEAVAEAHALGAPPLDLLIADEAHRCAGPVGGMFATVLDSDAILAQRRLFMTATPRYFTERLRREAEAEDFDVASMDDEENFGPVFYRMSFSEAIRRDLLSDYQVLVVGVDDAAAKAMVDRRQLVKYGEMTMDAEALAVRLAVLKAMQKCDLRRVLSFHGRVKGAKDFSNSLEAILESMSADSRPSGEIRADWVSGEMSAGSREVILARFRDLADGERAVLSNARCLAEGVDIPSIDGVVFVDPRRSQIDIVQAVGRAIRKAQDKKVGTVVIPVAVASSSDPNQALDASAFRPVWNVLRALRAHDDELAEELDALRRAMGRRDGTPMRLPSKLRMDLPQSVGEDFARSLGVRIVELSTEAWELWFGALKGYTDREGTSQVPIAHDEGGLSLGRWVASQRTAARRGDLSSEKVRRLENLPGWTWDPFADRWEAGFEVLVAFAGRCGHARPSGEHMEADFPLGQWAGQQRTAFAKGYLQPVRRDRLDALPGWAWDQSETDWNDAFDRFTAFVRREGHPNVPTRHVEDGIALGHWVSRQRTAGRLSRLDPDRSERLAGLPGWTWDLVQGAWDDAFSRLRRFTEVNGHAAPTADFRADDFNLGAWVNAQRVLRRTQALAQDRARKLEGLPGWQWEPFSEKWEKGFHSLQQYVAREGDSRVTEAHLEDGFPLGRWVAIQRRLHDSRTRKLPEDRATRLESLPKWTWDPAEATWEESFAKLLAHVRTAGHARVTRFQVQDGFRLGNWVSAQRVARSRGRLSESRATRLGALPGWVWDVDAEMLENALGSLAAFVAREGHARPKVDHIEGGYSLGKWVTGQRAAYVRGRLDQERVRRLEAYEGWTWDPAEAFWDVSYAALMGFARREGHARVVSTHQEGGLKLGSWVGAQRVAYRRGKLRADRKAALEAVPGWLWDVEARSRRR